MNENRTLLSRLTRIENIEIARNHVADYAAIIDSGESWQVAQLFAADGVLKVPSGDISGRDEIYEFYKSRASLQRKRHFITNLKTLETSASTVEIESYFLFTSQEPDNSVIGWGTYLDLIKISNGVACFVRKIISPIMGTTIAEGWAL